MDPMYWHQTIRIHGDDVSLTRSQSDDGRYKHVSVTVDGERASYTLDTQDQVVTGSQGRVAKPDEDVRPRDLMKTLLFSWQCPNVLEFNGLWWRARDFEVQPEDPAV